MLSHAIDMSHAMSHAILHITSHAMCYSPHMYTDNTCSDNVLRNHNAEEDEDPLSLWSLSGTGANFATVNSRSHSMWYV